MELQLQGKCPELGKKAFTVAIMVKLPMLVKKCLSC